MISDHVFKFQRARARQIAAQVIADSIAAGLTIDGIEEALVRAAAKSAAGRMLREDAADWLRAVADEIEAGQ